MFRLTMSPTLRLVIRPSLSLQKCLTPTPLIQLAAENVKDGDIFGDSVSVFTDWAIVGAPNSNKKGKAYLCKRVFGAWDDRQEIQASDGSDSDFFGGSVSINEKVVVIGAPSTTPDSFQVKSSEIEQELYTKWAFCSWSG